MTTTAINEMTFGIEIETSMPRGTVNPGRYHNGTRVSWLPAGWIAENDSSIHPFAGHIDSHGDIGVAEFIGLWKNPARLVIVRNGNPLRIGKAGAGTYFASLPEGLPRNQKTVCDNTATVYTLNKDGLSHGCEKDIEKSEQAQSEPPRADRQSYLCRPAPIFAGADGDADFVQGDTGNVDSDRSIRRGWWLD